jgi:hypothetical protein
VPLVSLSFFFDGVVYKLSLIGIIAIIFLEVSTYGRYYLYVFFEELIALMGLSLEKGNFRQWIYFILTHISELNLFPYLYNEVPILDTPGGYMIWKGFRARVLGVIF